MQRKWEECKTARECNLYMAEYMQEKAARVYGRLARGEINKHNYAWVARDLSMYYDQAREYLFAAMDATAE